MNRTELVQSVIDLLENLPTMESDTFDLTQSFWDEAAPFWSSYYSGDFTESTQQLLSGKWSDKDLLRFFYQLKTIDSYLK